MDLTSITLLLYGQCNHHTHREKYPTYLDHAGWYTYMKPWNEFVYLDLSRLYYN